MINEEEYKHKGQIKLFLGPMFSGKTSALINEIRRQSFAKKQILVIKFSHDNRYSND